MKTLTLRRKRTGDQGTFGEMLVDGQTLYTGELPWRDNEREHSCIPAGSYICTMTWSPKFNKKTYQVMDVPARTDVRIHVANLMGDTRKGFQAEVLGCIAPGLAMGRFGHQDGVSASSAAVSYLERCMAGEDFRLDILDEYLETGAPSGPAVA